ncbi:putative porin [Blattabacterium sp. (Nauphoeta cinerea)]|uniref:putative porin n=1 Tax=Blattabacterium sp. (Nauphoeta cinerea) TaxID=1316444 RepID=UPI001F3F336A|nr:putative porin [Blattabacterium sp. (Nauphoeta cinerea)]
MNSDNMNSDNMNSDNMNNMEKKIVKINIDKNRTENIEFYHPTYQDYKYWTEEKNIKKPFLEKYFSHNFFKYDNIRLFFNNGNKEKNNFNESMPKKMLFFKDPFFYREKIKYFDVKTPLSEIFYINNFLKKEKTLGGFFSQNLNEKINYSIEYRNFHSENKPYLKNTKSLVLNTFNYQDQNHYKLWGHYIYQKFDIEEKEKIPKWNIRNYKNILLSNKELIHNRYYISFIQKIYSFEEKKRFLFFRTYMEYEKYFRYHSFQPFQHWNRKKINHSYLRNGFFLIFNQKKINLEIGSIFDKIHYELFHNNIYKNKNINNLSIQSKIHYPINNVLEFDSDGKWIVENNDIKKSYIKANIKLNTFLFSKFWFLTQLNINENDNNIFFPIYILKKNQDYYNNEQKNIFSFYKKKTINFSLNSYKEKYHVSFYISKLNHSFQDQDQEKKIKKFLYYKYKYADIYGFKIKTIHDIWKFKLDNVFLYQKYNFNPLIFSIPNFLSRSTIFYMNNYFDKALFIQTGFSFHYSSKFYQHKIYHPFNYQTFIFEEKCIPNKIGGTPFVDYFLNLKIHRTIFYFSIQNIKFYNFYNENKNKNKSLIQVGFLWNLFT